MTLTLKALILAVLTAGAPAPCPVSTSVASPEVTAKTATIRYTPYLLEEESREKLALLLKTNFGITETKYEVSKAQDAEVTLVALSGGADRQAVEDFIEWYAFNSDSCENEE